MEIVIETLKYSRALEEVWVVITIYLQLSRPLFAFWTPRASVSIGNPRQFLFLIMNLQKSRA